MDSKKLDEIDKTEMTDVDVGRRGLLSKFSVGLVAAAGVAATSSAAAARAAADANRLASTAGSTVIDTRVRDAFPNVEMLDQYGRIHKLYEDLIQDKVVLLNFMSVLDERHLAVTAKLAELAKRLDRELNDGLIQMVSITRNPAGDTPSRLKEFAAEHGAHKNWLFLTGNQASADVMSLRMYRMKHAHRPGKRQTDIVFYGNGSDGVWGGFPVDIQVSDMAERVTWVMPQTKPVGKLRRAGPRVVNLKDTHNHNRQV